MAKSVLEEQEVRSDSSIVPYILRFTILFFSLLDLYIFRNHPHVKKGANTTIYCLSKFLDEYKRKNKGHYPEELYIQFDGGAENANKTVLAYLEYLVAKRTIRKIVYSRNPTGHTHEDIDRAFAVLWEYFKIKIVHTPDEYAQAIVEAYKKESYCLGFKKGVCDVNIVPDYTSWLEPHRGIQKRAHKEEYTQHQWRQVSITLSKI
jgi:hypothetical protein